MEAKLHAEVAAKFNQTGEQIRRQSAFGLEAAQLFSDANSMARRRDSDNKRTLDTKDTGLDENDHDDVLFNDDDYDISNKGNDLSDNEDLRSGSEMFEEDDSEETELKTESAF